MMSEIYTKKVLRIFKNPPNYGKIKNADGVGEVGNPVCGDMMKLYLKIGKRKGKKELFIKDIKFETFGCVAAIATSSIITQLAKGKTIKEALRINKEKVIGKLGGLPKIKWHCSVLAVDALAEAIYDYLSKNKKEIPQNLKLIHERIQKEKEIIKKRYKILGNKNF